MPRCQVGEARASIIGRRSSPAEPRFHLQVLSKSHSNSADLALIKGSTTYGLCP
jgi:hypothetical protein